MRDTSVRWGLGIGGVGSALGIVVLFIAARLLPISATDTNQSFELVMGLILLQVLFGFGMFGVMLSGAYYAGVRVERDRLAAQRGQQEEGEAGGGAPMTAASVDRRGSLIAGVIVMLCYWFVSTIFGLLVPALPQTAATRGSALDIAERALLSGVFFLVFGAAMGGFGGRSARAGNGGALGGTSRSLFDRIALPPLSPPAGAPPSPASSPTITPTTPAATSADAPAVHQSTRPSGE